MQEAEVRAVEERERRDAELINDLRLYERQGHLGMGEAADRLEYLAKVEKRATAAKAICLDHMDYDTPVLAQIVHAIDGRIRW